MYDEQTHIWKQYAHKEGSRGEWWLMGKIHSETDPGARATNRNKARVVDQTFVVVPFLQFLHQKRPRAVTNMLVPHRFGLSLLLCSLEAKST